MLRILGALGKVSRQEKHSFQHVLKVPDVRTEFKTARTSANS
jgi:hypothetical protein